MERKGEGRYSSFLKQWMLVMAVAGSVLLTACGGASTASSAGSAGELPVAETTAAAADMSYMENGIDQASGTGFLSEDAAAAAAYETEDAGHQVAGDISRKLIRTVSLNGETEQFEQVLSDISARVSELSGYIESMDRYAPGGTSVIAERRAHIVARIPADRLDSFLNSAFTGVHITRQSENAQDITLQYTDMDARVRVLRIEQERLMELLAKAESTDSLIALEQRLSEIRYELESLSSQLRLYDNQVSYSTVDISIMEVKRITATAEEGFLAQVRSGFSQNADRMGNAFRNIAICALTVLPILVPVAVFLFLVYSIIKIAVRRKRKGTSASAETHKPGKKKDTPADTDETLPAGNNSQHADDKAGETELHR
ncbi:MAG: DUF4349 domain-containing protein [Eubacteriales bacterium]|nr:DUF4349 domain-containing protein [Eubacteriales bacterium]